MKLLVVISWLLLTSTIWGQSIPLPYVRDGKWSLIDTNGSLILETQYSYINTFDQKGFSFFCQNGAYGIIDHTGKVMVPAIYADVQQNGFGNYRLLSPKGWSRLSLSNSHLNGGDTLDRFDPISVGWAIVGTKDSLFVEHLQTGKRWQFVDSIAHYQALHDHLVLKLNDSTSLFIDGTGQVIYKGKLFIRSQNNLHHINFKREHYLFDANGVWNIPAIQSVKFEATAVFIRTKNEGIYCAYNRTELLRGSYEEISEFDDRYYEVQKNGLITLLDKTTKQQAFPYRYESIYPSKEGQYTVYYDGKVGLLNWGFQEIIPCKYERFILEGDLAKVYQLNYVGLYSVKNKKELLPPIYNSVLRTGMRFKATRNELITIIEINEQHQITKTAKIDNALTVSLINSPQTNSRQKFIDKRLFSIGWFLDSTLITPASGTAYYALKWGLKNDQDSLLIPASIPDLHYIPFAPFTFQYTGKVDYKQSNGSKSYLQNFRAIYYPTGKTLNKYTFNSYDSTDFKKRQFMRVYASSGFGILQADGTFLPVSYIEKGSNRYLRYCISDKIEIATSEQIDMTEISSPSYSDFYIEHPIMRTIKDNKPVYGLLYPGGNWNFFTPEGKPLFRDTFTFVNPFVGNQAIVRKNKLWGVVSSDTLIIPAVYSKVERFIIHNDTFFVASNTQNGIRFLDTTSHTLSENYTIVSSTPNAIILEQLGQKYLNDPSLKQVSEGYSSMRFLKNGLILAKTRKEYTLLTTDGTILYSGLEPPESVLFEAFLVFKKGATFYLTDLALTPIIENCSSIEQQGNFTLIHQNGQWHVYNQTGKLVIPPSNGKVLIDVLGDEIAVIEKDRLSIYTETGERINRLKGILPTQFIAGKLIVELKDSCFIYSKTGNLEQTLPNLQSFRLLEDGSIILKLKKYKDLLFDRNWSPILEEESHFSQIEHCGPSIYSFNIQNGKTVLYNHLTSQKDSNYQVGYGSFENDRLLVKKGNRFCYIDSQFRPITARTFDKAIPFCGNFAAVADSRGWALIDRQCRPLTFPNYGVVSSINQGLFQTVKLPLKGVYNANGELLIPVEYEQIFFLENGIIQCVKNGELYYFRKDGTNLLSIK